MGPLPSTHTADRFPARCERRFWDGQKRACAQASRKNAAPPLTKLRVARDKGAAGLRRRRQGGNGRCPLAPQGSGLGIH